jgi:hypothetical protein
MQDKINKQETLEEVAERIYPINIIDDELVGCVNYDTNKEKRDIWVNGAKWRQEQDKNKYSEEDMITAIQYTINNFFNGKLAGLNSEEIFKQFKNK